MALTSGRPPDGKGINVCRHEPFVWYLDTVVPVCGMEKIYVGNSVSHSRSHNNAYVCSDHQYCPRDRTTQGLGCVKKSLCRNSALKGGLQR